MDRLKKCIHIKQLNVILYSLIIKVIILNYLEGRSSKTLMSSQKEQIRHVALNEWIQKCFFYSNQFVLLKKGLIRAYL